MSTDQLRLSVLTERPVVRNDQTTDIDIAVDLTTTKSIGSLTTNYAINLCIVIDRSGSMSGEKLEQAKRSCVDIYERLSPADRLTVLAFDTEVVSVVNPQTPPASIKERILSLTTGGQTDLSKGWYLGLLELQTYATDKHLNRLILLSDGQANSGEQKPSVLGSESSRAHNELAITTSTIGIGKDFQEDILAALAHESGGRFWFIGDSRIEDIVKEEFSGALSVYLERPRIDLTLPSGISVLRELNDLPKTSGRYRLRPIKANDQFALALRVRVDPAQVAAQQVPIAATLYDGAGVVERAEAVLNVGSVQDYVQSPDDPRVAMVVKKYLATTSDEKIVEQMDAGNVTKMLDMLREQSDLMKELEAKLAGVAPISWETMSERERAQAEAERQELERERARILMEIEENEALSAVGQLVNLMQGLDLAGDVFHLLRHARKMHHHRGARNVHHHNRGFADDDAARTLLEMARDMVPDLTEKYPHLRDELTAIAGKLNEQLARFSR